MATPSLSHFLHAVRIAALGALGLAVVTHGVGAAMSVQTDHADGVYASGDTVMWSITWTGGGSPPASTYVFKSGGLKQVAQGSLVFSGNTASLQSGFSAPGTMLLDVAWAPTSDANHAFAGAVAAPAQIQPASPRPADFDAFWASKIAELAAVPANPVLQTVVSGRAGVDYWKITMDNIRGTHTEGQIARPQTGTKFPALLIVQYAGIYALQKNWVTDRAAEGWLALNLMAHDLPIDETTAFYTAQANGPLANYWAIGNDDRDTSYYLRMYLSCYQAVEYLKSRPDWDGTTIVVMGASQGGQQAFVTAGLEPGSVTAVLALVPAACDMLAPEADRASGFPNWYAQTYGGRDPTRVHEASRYYDPANFAAHIECPTLVALGLYDTTAPPSSVLAAVNQMPAPREVLLLQSGHQDVNGSQTPFNTRAWGAWLPALRSGQPAPVAGVPEITVQPGPLVLPPGGRISLWVDASGVTPMSYQWSREGTPIAGATARFFEIASATAEDAGAYSVVVSNAAGSVTSDTATVTLDAGASAHLANLSIRSALGIGGSILNPGFVLSGSGSRSILIRAIGPTLGAFKVTGAIADPKLAVFAGSSPIFENDDWGSAANAATMVTTSQTLGAFALEAGSLDAVVLQEFSPGAYTAKMSGVSGASGIGLLELYEAGGGASRLVNISARADVDTGDQVVIPGFVIEGTGASTCLIRAVGPGLAHFGVSGWLGNPVLTLTRGAGTILANDDWGQASDLAALNAATQLVGAFPLDAGSADAAMLVVLMPGQYTAQAAGVGGGTGNVLVEVYQVP